MRFAPRALALITMLALALTGCSATPDSEINNPGGQGGEGGGNSTMTVAEQYSGNSTGPERLATPWFNSGNLSQTLTFRALFKPVSTDLQDVEPDLAESHELSADGKTLTVKLKDGLKWSDGQPITGDDVAWSLSTVLRVSQVNAIYTGAFKQIEGADAIKPEAAGLLSGVSVDGQTVTIRLQNPVSNLLPVLGQFMILPKHKLEAVDPLKMHTDAFWEQPVTSNMFKVDELSVGQFMTLGLNEHYEGKKPSITTINITGSADPISDAQSGRIDYFFSNSADQVAGMKDVSTFDSHPVEVLFYRYLIFNLSDPAGPFADPRTREALRYGIDIAGLTSSLYPDLGTVINSGVPEGFDGHDSTLPKPTYDPERAKQMLTEAGFDFTKEVRLRYYYGDQTSINFMTAVAQQLQQLGMKVNVLKFQGDATTELYENRAYEIALKGLSSFGFNEWYGEYTNSTFVKIIGEQPEIAAANAKLSQATDEAGQQAALRELQQLEQQKQLKLPMLRLNYVVYTSQRLQGPKDFANPLYNYDIKFADWTIQ